MAGFYGRHWCFTWNNYPLNGVELVDSALQGESKVVFQEEKGEETGTPHLQGYVCFKTKKRLSNVRTFIDCHWEPCNNPKAAIKYCMKKETRAGQVHVKGVKLPLELPTALRPWQQQLADDLLSKPDPRSITWIWESVGNTGKSTMCKWLVDNAKYNAIYLNGKGADIKYALTKHFEKTDTNYNHLICLWDLSRSMEEYVSYDTMEQIKNGLFFSGKYESCSEVFNAPHVVVFANFPPETSKMSQDRWDVRHIGSWN